LLLFFLIVFFPSCLSSSLFHVCWTF
jgi:hypothetical protein